MPHLTDPPLSDLPLSSALTNDVELGEKLHRVPIFASLGLSLRAFAEDRFLVTDTREVDERRGVLPLASVVRAEQFMSKADVGMDSRQFVDMGGLVLFKGKDNEAGQIVPYGNVTVAGGIRDSDHTLWTATGDEEEKRAKLIRYTGKNPDEVTWRSRTPILMAGQTSVIDYLALRVTQLQFLHSIAIKWSDRRWDSRQVPVTGDLFRPENERSDLIILAPVWMDEGMNVLDPNIWGPYEDIVRANYSEYLARTDTDYRKELETFTETFKEYMQILAINFDTNPFDVTTRTLGRLERKQSISINRTLHLPFSRNIDTRDDSYQSLVFDPDEAIDVTQDIFNVKQADGAWRYTSSFEAKSLILDGWIGDGTATQVADVPADLPPFVETVQGTKSLELQGTGFVARRMILPDGDFILRFRHKSVAGIGRVEIVRNTRLKTKAALMDVPTSRVLSLKHFRESYETVASSTLEPLNQGEWEEFFISFKLKDHYFVQDEGYPAHEVYIVISGVDDATTVRFDHLELLVDRSPFEMEVVNTATRSRFPFLLKEDERQLDLEFAFGRDTPFPTNTGWERAVNKYRFDGANTCAVVKHRPSYNLKPTGTNLNFWFKVNSEDEARFNVLQNRGAFVLCQKVGAYLPSYSVTVNDRKELTVSTFEGNSARSVTSKEFRNLNLHTITYERYWFVFQTAGKQPRHYFESPSETATLEISSQDFYLTLGGSVEMDDTIVVPPQHPLLPSARTVTEVTAWKYYEWHARRAYGSLVPVDDLKKFESFGAYMGEAASGTVFLSIPINPELVDLPGYFGNYDPSPNEYSPNEVGISPDDPNPIPFPWPINIEDYGPEFSWPTSPAFGAPPEFVEWYKGTDVEVMQTPLPAFVEGALQFDRWLNLDVNASSSGVDIRVQSEFMASGSGGEFNTTLDRENVDDLHIGTSNPDDTNTCAPISVFSFKITQRKLPEAAIKKQFWAETINFNEVLYLTYADFIDFDGEGTLDFWQADLTDYGLATQWVDQPADVGEPVMDREDIFPDDPSKVFGEVVVTTPDPIILSARADQDYTVLDDFFDDPYLEELVNIQRLGFRDGLLFWDFLTDDNNDFHSISVGVWNEECARRETRILSYREWLLELVGTEFNTVRAVTDTIPTLEESGALPSPQPPAQPTASPWPTWGDDADELVMTGVKGWFGFRDLLGYRDSLEKVLREGIIGNYFQIEFRFRADRSSLEALLADHAQSYNQLFLHDFEERRLK